MAGGWVECGHGGARWPATRLSFVTAAGLSFVTAGLDLGRRLVWEGSIPNRLEGS